MQQKPVMQSNPIGWFEINVDHIDLAQRFYESALQYALFALPLPGDSDARTSQWYFRNTRESRSHFGGTQQRDGSLHL